MKKFLIIAILLTTISIYLIGCVKSNEDSSQPTQRLSFTPTNFTDDKQEIWIKGIASKWAAAFFVPAPITGKTMNDFAVGRKASFSDGTIRRIVKLEKNGQNLIVFLEGIPLDGDKVGYPNTIR